MDKLKSSKAIALVATALFFASLFWLMNTYNVNDSLEAGLAKEKLNSESLLSEKLLLEKDIRKFKDQLSSLKASNLELDNVIKSTHAKLEKQEAEYNRMKRETVALAQIKKQRKELIAMQSQLENELQTLKSSYDELAAKNNNLINTVTLLQERNKMLTEDLNRAMFASIDQSQIQAVKGKSEKLTVRARRTKKLIATFEVPANLKNLTFRIVDAKGNALSQENGVISTMVTPSNGSYTASSDAKAKGNKLQKVQMVYVPQQKLQTGVYTVEILNENLYVGSVKVKLD